MRQSSDVRVNLVDRVLRYEITETFVNRGSRVGEADFMFPLPKGAAFQDLNSRLVTLKSKADSLRDPATFFPRAVASSGRPPSRSRPRTMARARCRRSTCR